MLYILRGYQFSLEKGALEIWAGMVELEYVGEEIT